MKIHIGQCINWNLTHSTCSNLTPSLKFDLPTWLTMLELCTCGTYHLGTPLHLSYWLSRYGMIKGVLFPILVGTWEFNDWKIQMIVWLLVGEKFLPEPKRKNTTTLCNLCYFELFRVLWPCVRYFSYSLDQDYTCTHQINVLNSYTGN